MKVLVKLLIIIPLFFLSANLNAQASHFTEIENGILHYQVIGSGKPILIINGGPGINSNGFMNLAERLADLGYQCILYDQRGTGKSELKNIDSTTITMNLMTEDIEVIRNEIGCDKWIVFGHSFGGIMANYYASKFPNYISGIIHSSSGGIDLEVLENAGARINELLSESERDSLTYWRQQLSSNPSEENRVNHSRAIAKAYVVSDEHVPVVTARMKYVNMNINSLVWQDLRQMNYDCKQTLTNFQQPVLIVQGKQDVVTDDMALAAHSTFPNSTLVFLDSCGHYGWLDQEKKYFGAIKKFLISVEKEEIEQQITNYVKSIYEHDTTFISRYTDELIQKSGYFYSKKSKSWSYHFMNYHELIETALTYNSKKWIPDWAPIEIEIFEVKEKIASAKVKAIWGFDYILLSKNENGNWKIDKILWQSYSETETKEYFKILNQRFKQ